MAQLYQVYTSDIDGCYRENCSPYIVALSCIPKLVKDVGFLAENRYYIAGEVVSVKLGTPNIRDSIPLVFTYIDEYYGDIETTTFTLVPVKSFL